ncbi:MAG TPA: hypothetical protein HPP66_00125 [Planctomycetes bacterium]|nr:hypothetical protein [Planctomycetota bacterium]
MGGFSRKILLFCTLILFTSPIQTAPAEPNTVEIDVFENVISEQQLQMPDGTTEIIRMTGEATEHVFFEGPREGLANDDDGDELDEVKTEMVELNLTGLSSMLGSVQLRLLTGIPSIGQMEETKNDKSGLLEVPPFGDGMVESFFDIFFEIEVAGQLLYGRDPMHLRGLLSEKSAGPMDIYENLGNIQLFDINGNPTGLLLGPGRLRPNPPVEVDVFETPLCHLDLQAPDGSTVTEMLTGRTTERVFFEGAHQGSAYDDDGNLLDEVQTEMVELDLKGYSSMFGPMQLRLNTDMRSAGRMEERTDYNTGVLDVPPFFKDGMVDSFFDIYFELDVLGATYYNRYPMHLRAVLSHKPAGPMDIYENLTQVQMYDENGNPTGFYIGAIRYRPNPVVEVDVLDTSMGLIDLVTPSGQTYPVELVGTSKMHVFFERDFKGSANDDDGDGLDEVKTEIVELNLSGFDPWLGEVRLGLDESTMTMGEIEESSDIKTGRLDLPPFAETGSADSFFDVHFEIEVDGMIMYGARPMLWRGVLNEKPAAPGDIYENLENIKLVDAPGTETGYTLGASWYEPIACGDAAHPYPIGDLNLDCRVNFLDVAILALHWLECTRPDCY